MGQGRGPRGSASPRHSLSAHTVVTNIVSALYGNFLPGPLYPQGCRCLCRISQDGLRATAIRAKWHIVTGFPFSRRWSAIVCSVCPYANKILHFSASQLRIKGGITPETGPEKRAEPKHSSSNFRPGDIDQTERAMGQNITWQPPSTLLPLQAETHADTHKAR